MAALRSGNFLACLLVIGTPELKELLIMPELNECLLFHGTSANNKDALVNQAIDPRLGSNEALFGQGCYFAESSTKADQYAGCALCKSCDVFGTDFLLDC